MWVYLITCVSYFEGFVFGRVVFFFFGRLWFFKFLGFGCVREGGFYWRDWCMRLHLGAEVQPPSFFCTLQQFVHGLAGP